VSHLRPELGKGKGTDPTPRGGTAYLMIYNAVQERNGLIHGKLHQDGWSCAIGSFFDVNPHAALYEDLIDEVAAVNDSAPHMTLKQRKEMVSRWLRWKLTQLGMPGFRTLTF
jgi:hypothetical protein